MKFIHTADLHLGSRLTSLPAGEVRDAKKRQLRKAFDEMVEYAKKHTINLIVMSGDVFDLPSPNKKDKELFYKTIKNNPDINFVYLKGNHDNKESFTEDYPNLYLFSEEWKTYTFEDIKVSGIELSDNNASSLYSTLSLDKDDFNVVMMHGDITANRGKDAINLKKLINKNIDYLALGHIHKGLDTSLDSRGKLVYPGSLFGRGFDEEGEKGFYVVEVNDKKENHFFVPSSDNIVVVKEIDVSSTKDIVELNNLVKSEIKNIDKSAMVKLELVGKVSFDIDDLEKDIEEMLRNYFFYLKVNSEVRKHIVTTNYDNDLSLKGEFVRIVSSLETSEENKDEILNIGLRLLEGEDIA